MADNGGYMTDNHSFCRGLYNDIMLRVREKYTREQIKKVWAWSSDRKQWEFHGPNGEYIYNLHMADCVWSAKAEGWSKLIEPVETDKNS